MVITVGVLLLFLKVSRATGIFLEYIYIYSQSHKHHSRTGIDLIKISIGLSQTIHQCFKKDTVHINCEPVQNLSRRHQTIMWI